MDTLRTKAREWMSVASFLMVTVLFTIWAVFGASTVNRQNHDILAGVQAQLERVESANRAELDSLDDNTRDIRASTDALACILLIDPDHRGNRNVQRCVHKYLGKP